MFGAHTCARCTSDSLIRRCVSPGRALRGEGVVHRVRRRTSSVSVATRAGDRSNGSTFVSHSPFVFAVMRSGRPYRFRSPSPHRFLGVATLPFGVPKRWIRRGETRSARRSETDPRDRRGSRTRRSSWITNSQIVEMIQVRPLNGYLPQGGHSRCKVR